MTSKGSPSLSAHRLGATLAFMGAALFASVFALPANAEPPTCFGRAATIVGDDGDNRLTGGDGVDVIVGAGGRDILDGAGGNDFICGNGSRDTLVGADGDDWLDGDAGRDFLTGVDGDDVLFGRSGPDVLNFGDEENGDDDVFGGAGDDGLSAGVGADRLFAGAGDDRLTEGEVDAPIADLFSGGIGTDTCSPGAEDVVRGCELPL